MRKQFSRCCKISYIAIVVIGLAIGMFIFLAIRINSGLERIIKLKVEQSASEVITECIGASLAQTDINGSYVDIDKDENGNVQSIGADSMMINSLSNLLEKEIGKALKNDDNYVSFPVGELTGVNVLSGSGFDIDVNYYCIGDVHTEVKSEFESVGINQTRYSLKLYLSAKVNAVLPVKATEIDVAQEYLLSETVIVGEIPSVFWGNT